MRLRIEKIVYPGRSLGRNEGKTVFTDRGLPGELVEVEARAVKPTYIDAETKLIVEPSPRRTEPRCGHHRVCSPCQEMDYALQLEIKTAQVAEILAHDAGLEATIEAEPSPEIWGYRNRLRLALSWDGDRPRLAYHVPGSRDAFVPLDHCHLVTDAMGGALRGARDAAAEAGARDIEAVEVRAGHPEGRPLIVYHLSPGARTGAVRAAARKLEARKSLAGIVALVTERRGVREIRLAGRDFVKAQIGESVFQVGARAFFQVNAPQLEKVAAAIQGRIRALGRPVVADLYAGIGTFGLICAGAAERVIAVESEPENVADLERNIALNRAGNVSVREGRSEAWVGRMAEEYVDAVIVDPPRKGLDRAVVEALVARPVPLLAYLSCNPSTLARDIKSLRRAYQVAGLRIYDFFPQTPHIETLAFLERGKK
jgi:23S rRNA (uracil1939-C5)-methyltransferase